MNGINKTLAQEKGLIINEDKSKYDKLVKNYKYLLEYYINSKIDLSKYDELIKNSGLYIGINSKFKSLNEYLKLDYIFLINNLFVEKLSTEYVDKIINFNEINNELTNIVDKTFKDIIFDNYFDNEYKDMIIKVCYGDVIPRNMVNNNSLVFKIYYGKNLIDLNGDEFIDLHEKQLAFFDDLMNKLKNEVKEKLGVTCEILLEKDLY